jgi:hypothetical protein
LFLIYIYIYIIHFFIFTWNRAAVLGDLHTQDTDTCEDGDQVGRGETLTMVAHVVLR